MMTWRKFLTVFCVIQLAGVCLAILGIIHSFVAVILGMALLFPASLIISAQSNVGSAALIVAIMLAINVVFWMALLRPQSIEAR
jgi:hypothetical protein